MSLVDDRINAIINSENFLEALLKEIRKSTISREDIAKYLAEQHNNKKINLVEQFTTLQNNGEYSFFDLRHIFELALPDINSPVLPVMHCVKHLVESVADNEYTKYNPIDSFKTFCKQSENRIDEAIQYAITDFFESFDFIAPTLVAGANINIHKYVNKAIEFLQNAHKFIVCSSISALRNIDYKKQINLINIVIDSILKISTQSEEISAVSLSALVELNVQDNSQEQKIVQYISSSQYLGNHIVFEASKSLFVHAEKLGDEIALALLDLCTNINKENERGLRNLDQYFFILLNKNYDDATFKTIFTCMEKIFEHSNFEITIKHFDNVKHRLFEKENTYLPKLLTRWLLSQNVQYGRMCEELFQGKQYNWNLKFDLSQLTGKNEYAQYRLACKTIGWLFFQAKSAMQLIISLLPSCNEGQKKHIAHKILHHLLISYPNSVSSILRETIEVSGEKIAEFCEDILQKYELFAKNCEKAMKMNELKPSEKQRGMFEEYRANRMYKMWTETSANYPIFDNAPVVHLPYGTKIIQYQQNHEVSERVEQGMNRFALPFEFPVLSILNPHDLAVELSVLKGTLKLNETNY